MNENIAKALAVLPDKPGVYLMHDEHGKVIYVGKAVVLKNRVRSYFRNLASHTVKVKALVSKVAEIETIVTAIWPRIRLRLKRWSAKLRKLKPLLPTVKWKR